MSAHHYPHLVRAFQAAPVQYIGDYPYPISPFAGVTNPISQQMLAEVAQGVLNESRFTQADLIVTFESAGTQLAAVASQVLNIPYLVARKKRFDLPSETVFAVTTNFDQKSFYVYGNVTGKKILIIDDVVASGTTVKNAAVALKSAGADVLALFTVAAKSNLIGKKYEDCLKDIDVPLISLIKVKVIDGKVVVFSSD